MNDKKTHIRGKIRDYVLKEAMADIEKISDDTLIFREGYFDSMGFIKMLSFIEETFNVKANDAELIEANFESIRAISEFLFRKKEN